jgi:cysteine desulfurase
MNKPIYLDYNATTPCDPEVFQAMEPFFVEQFGNASSSSHSYGWEASHAVKKARQQVADLLGCDPKEIIWTSGATESNNMAILGLVRQFANQQPHIITENTEHKAVLEVFEMAEELGIADATFLPVDEQGLIGKQQVKDALTAKTKLVSIMMANNEIGTLQPIDEIADLLESHDSLFHSDAAQAAGKVEIDLQKLKVDMLSISGHKMYGPKGIGALFVRKSNPATRLLPIIKGGAQENGLRPGTLNVPGIVGLGAACELCARKMKEENGRLIELRDQLIRNVLEACPEACLNGHPSKRLPNNASFSFDNLSSDVFALGLSGLALSSGSACTSSDGKPSHVISALGRPEAQAKATIRVGLGRLTTAEDIQITTQKIIQMVEKNRALSNK